MYFYHLDSLVICSITLKLIVTLFISLSVQALQLNGQFLLVV